jgi:hypothetical protein
MATTYRLNAFSIFLILLAALLIGYLLNYTWESFMGCGCGGNKKTQEGFANLSTVGEVVSGYSENAKKVMKLHSDTDVYYDQIGKNFIESIGENKLKITKRNNDDTEHTYASSSKEVIDLGIGKFSNVKHFDTGDEVTGNDSLAGFTIDENSTVADENSTVAYAKTKFEDLSGTQLLELTFAGDITSIEDTMKPTSLKVYNVSTSLTAKSDIDKKLTGMKATDTKSYRFALVAKDSNYVVPDPPSAATEFIYTADDNAFAFLHVPLKKDNVPTDVTFIHVMDLREGKSLHKETFYFRNSNVEQKFVGASIVNTTGEIDYSVLLGGTNELDFAIESMKTDLDRLGTGDFEVNTEHKSGDNAIQITARKKETTGHSAFRALITFDKNQKPILSKIETSLGTSEDGTLSSGESNDLSEQIKEYRRLQGMLFGYSEMRSPFYDYDGSPYTDYILKTEVIPPVCPSCPSCPQKGVCTNCGGKGGSGTGDKDSAASLARDFGSGTDKFIRDGADGATNLARDAVSGTYGAAKETASGVTNVAGNVASGVTDAGGKLLSGTGDFVKDSASGVGQFTKDAAGGIYGAATDVASGTVGLGKDIVSGTYNAASDVVGAVAQGIPNYGSPNPQSGPNMQMGGYANSYGGTYMNQSQQMPQTVGQDPYSYFGAVPPKKTGCNYMPRTADFSAFGK